MTKDWDRPPYPPRPRKLPPVQYEGKEEDGIGGWRGMAAGLFFLAMLGALVWVVIKVWPR